MMDVLHRKQAGKFRAFILTACLILGIFGQVSMAQEPALDLEKYRGKVVYLDFWASWCIPCRASFPWMNAMGKKYGNGEFTIITVNLDKKKAYMDEFLSGFSDMRFTVIRDPEAKLAREWEVAGMPASFLIDRKGNIRYSHIGFFSDEKDEYEAQILELLNEKP